MGSYRKNVHPMGVLIVSDDMEAFVYGSARVHNLMEKLQDNPTGGLKKLLDKHGGDISKLQWEVRPCDFYDINDKKEKAILEIVLDDGPQQVMNDFSREQYPERSILNVPDRYLDSPDRVRKSVDNQLSGRIAAITGFWRKPESETQAGGIATFSGPGWAYLIKSAKISEAARNLKYKISNGGRVCASLREAYNSTNPSDLNKSVVKAKLDEEVDDMFARALSELDSNPSVRLLNTRRPDIKGKPFCLACISGINWVGFLDGSNVRDRTRLLETNLKARRGTDTMQSKYDQDNGQFHVAYYNWSTRKEVEDFRSKEMCKAMVQGFEVLPAQGESEESFEAFIQTTWEKSLSD